MPRSGLKLVIFAACIVFLLSCLWEWRTRIYLRAFDDSIIAAGATDEEKVTDILAWISNGPRRGDGAPLAFADRDPISSLNNTQALKICGSSSTAFINLATVAGLDARRVLLMDNFMTRHVVVQVYVRPRGWIWVDPSLRAEICPPRAGQRDFIRLARIPFAAPLETFLMARYPNYSASPAITLFFVRQSFFAMVSSAFILFLLVLRPAILEMKRRLRLHRINALLRISTWPVPQTKY
jgi:hypothetical protein